MTVSVLLKPSLAQTTPPPSQVEAIRTEMQQMQTEYEARMKQMQERLNRMEQAQQPAATPAGRTHVFRTGHETVLRKEA